MIPRDAQAKEPFVRGLHQVRFFSIDQVMWKMRHLRCGVRELRALLAERWAGTDVRFTRINIPDFPELVIEGSDDVRFESAPPDVDHSYKMDLRNVDDEALAIRDADHECEPWGFRHHAVRLDRAFGGSRHMHDLVAVFLMQRCSPTRIYFCRVLTVRHIGVGLIEERHAKAVIPRPEKGEGLVDHL